MQLDITELYLPNPGVLKTRLPNSIFEEVQALAIKTYEAAVPYNDKLAGHIEKEYTFNVPWSLKKTLNIMFQEYQNKFQYYVGDEYVVRDQGWMNYQKKHEFNPLHFHYGAASWVLWVQIPYKLHEEYANPSLNKANHKVASQFEFVYNKLDGGITTFHLPIDKDWEGTLIMFPAYLKHSVYPFYTSDELRISVSGNIDLREKSNK